MAQTLARSLEDAERIAARLIDEWPAAIFRVLGKRASAQRRKYQAQCPVCGVTIHTAHDQQTYCSHHCRNVARYQRIVAARAERRALIRGELPPLPDPPPMPSKPRTRRRDPGS